LSAANGLAPDAVVLAADRRGSVLFVQTDAIEVELVGLTLTGGKAEVGGAVAMSAFATVVLRGCTLRGNAASEGVGGAVHADAGRLELRGCAVVDNTCGLGVAVHADGVASVVLADGTDVRGAVSEGAGLVQARDGAELEVTGSRIAATRGSALAVSGTASRKPDVYIRDSRLIGTPSARLQAQFAGRTTIEASFLSSPAEGIYKPIGQVVVGAK